MAARRGVTRKQLAQLVGRTVDVVDGWKRAGCPRLKSGRFVPARVFEWLRERDATKHAAAAEKLERSPWLEQGQRALAMMRLHNLAVQRGEYLSKKQVHEEWRQRAFAASRRLLALPRHLAARAPVADAQFVERECMAVVRQMLTEYARNSEALHMDQSQDSSTGTSPSPTSTDPDTRTP